MTDPIKYGYITAMWDQASSVASLQDKYAQARAYGLGDCGRAVKPTAAMLAEAIDRHYQSNLVSWKTAPAPIFYDAIVFGVWKRHVNEQRKTVS